MRIIRGTQKGKKIFPPKGFNSRPTTDYAKESLFNILENRYDIKKLTVLDLFSGTGNISFEFLSRECEKVTSVEINKKNSFHIQRCFNELFPNKNYNIITSDVYKFCKKANLFYDLIFADPPYDDIKIDTLPSIIFNNITLDKTLLIIEHSSKIDFSSFDFYFETRRYGNVNFSFFKKN